jgi:putative sigma-54 modulation protein
MRMQFTARHDHVSDAVQQYAEEKLTKLERRRRDLVLVEVTFSREHNPSIADDHAVEAIVHTTGPNLVARESAPTYELAIDRVLKKLERQVERQRDKRTLEVRRRGQQQEPPVPPEDPSVLPEDDTAA